MAARPSQSLPELRRFLENHLLDSVVPFWVEHAIDPAGGINTCIKDDGTLVNRDKWLWSQWRAVWVFASLYTMVEPRPQWLQIAKDICAFSARHGWDEQVGGWALRLSGDGQVLDGCDSLYVDGFAIYGLVALARITNDDETIALARRTADNAIRRLQAPHDTIPHFPYPIPPGARVHGLPMMFALTVWELGQFLDDQGYRQAALEMSDDIFANFYRRDRDMILERIAADNREFPSPLGSVVVPGHVIEDMWFQIHIARDRGDTQRINEAVRLTRRHMELGWDETHGGIILAIDADGGLEIGWQFADTKLWWPQTEAMYALLLAYEVCREDWCLSWYDKVHTYAFDHYPVAEHGEWRQKLSRDGTPFTDTVALPVKDPFHLPRALLYCIDVLGRVGGA
jgi:N-acylglucosamine 2-epimerase